MTAYVVQSVLGIIGLLSLRKKYIVYLIVTTIEYLCVLTVVGTLDISMVIYLILIMLPLLNSLRITISSLPVYLYFLVYIIIGCTMQDVQGTMITLVCKYFQFIVFFLVLDSSLIDDARSSYLGVIYMATIAECVLGIYLTLNGAQFDKNSGMVRLVSNSQPITGNLCVVVLPLIIVEYYRNRTNHKMQFRLIVISAIFLIWVILSGTRGYLVVWLFSMIPIICDFAGIRFVNRRLVVARTTVILFIACVAIVLVVFMVPDIWTRISTVLRLESGIGIRVYENAMVMDFWKNSGALVCLFGIGMGGNGCNYPAYVNALDRQHNLGMWNYSSYYYNAGSIFHNLYANVLLTQGIVGIAVFGIMSWQIFRHITRKFVEIPIVKTSLVLYMIGFLIMNYYRWSGTCGIAEMIVLALVVREGITYSPVNIEGI